MVVGEVATEAGQWRRFASLLARAWVCQSSGGYLVVAQQEMACSAPEVAGKAGQVHSRVPEARKILDATLAEMHFQSPSTVTSGKIVS